MTSKDLARQLASRLIRSKGVDVQVFDLHEICSFTDFFVIATGTSKRHVKTLAESTLKGARERGERPLGVEGDPPGRWILVDLGQVVVHLFEEEARAYYALERLWDDAERIRIPGPASVAEAS